MMSFWVPKFDGSFDAHVAAHLERAAGVYERASEGEPCPFDRSTLEWLDSFARSFVARQPQHTEDMMTAFGIVVGEIVRRAFDGVWCLVSGQLEEEQVLPTIKLPPGNIFVVPWIKVDGYIHGNDGDSLVAFFDSIDRERMKPHEGTIFLS